MRIETITTLEPLVLLGIVAHPGVSYRAAVLSAREIATLRSAERIAAKLRAVIADQCGCEHVELSELGGVDLDLARLEHSAAQLADDGCVAIS